MHLRIFAPWALAHLQLSLLLPALLFAFACSGTQAPRSPVSEPLPSELADGHEFETPSPPPPVPTLGPAEELIASVDHTPSTREALEKAIEWAMNGLRLYEAGDHPAALQHLDDARIFLLEADLPEIMQEQGLGVLGCALSDDLRHHDLEAVATLLAQETEPDSELAEQELIERQVRRILERFGAGTPRQEYLDIFVDEVARYVDYYRGAQRQFFERSYDRMHKYWPTIEEVFESRSIPVELGYMALVESGFNPRARSHAGARGLWQFIPSTGQRYGLRRLDDLHDVRLSTEAAAEYLLDLIGIFGPHSFLLATAAYNAGEGRIQGCLRKLDNPFEQRSFWEIRDCLARETREYVPRVMAAAVIASDPARFGFDLESPEAVRQRYDVVTLPTVTRLSRIAERAGTSVAELRTANTDLPSTATSTPVRNFPLYVPTGGGERLAAAYPEGPPPEAPRASAPSRRADSAPARSRATGPGRTLDYRARSGDTLSEIGEWFGVSVAELKDWNPALRGRLLRSGERLRIRVASDRVYRVQPGDTLSQVAEEHDLDYRQVAAWNGLSSPYRLRAGQELVLAGGIAPRRIVYTVRPGNSLQTIAEIFAVRYRDLMAWNDLRGSTVRAGQRLVIFPPDRFETHDYKVRRGDTISRIARRFGVPPSTVLTANGLGSRTLIRPGQRLVVYAPS